MEKLEMQTKDLNQEKIKIIGKIFPNCITEVLDGKDLEYAIDFESLKAELSGELTELPQERYQFTWPGKYECNVSINQPINKTLRPDYKNSVNFNKTKNIYIESDNLDALKLIRETYLNKIDMIYIDPPYNTGNDFVYCDNFSESEDSFLDSNGDFDSEGLRLFINKDSSGRFHTNWLNMIYPRIKIARDLLSDNGAIFISIDDNEVDNLSKVCNEIFGERNRICKFIWKSKLGKVGTTGVISTVHEYILCYAKNIDSIEFNKIVKQTEGRKENLRQWGTADRREDRPSMYYPICIGDTMVYPVKEDGTDGRWRVGKEMASELLKQGCLQLEYKKDKANIYRIFPPGISETPFDSIISDVGTTANGTIMLKKLGMANTFDYSKPVDLIKFFIKLFKNKDITVLDFFSGSATTAQAVLDTNLEDSGNRNFICIQIPELVPEKSEAYKKGYKTICEIARDRINSYSKTILDDIDCGYRVFKLDTSNMNDVFYSPEVTFRNNLDSLIDNVKMDRTSSDLLFQVLLELGIELSCKIDKLDVDGKSVYSVDDGYLLACFDEDISENVVMYLAKTAKCHVVIRESSLGNDEIYANFEQIFKTYSDVIPRVL